MIQAVLFDLDGTLIDTHRLYFECYRRALHDVFGRRLTDAELIEMHKGRISELGLLERAFPPDQLQAGLERFYADYSALHESHFEGVYDGVVELLSGLRSAGRRIGIVTGKSRRAWELSCTHIELGEFDAYVFDDDVAEPKPDPEGILRALKALDLDSAETCYVGDGRGDMLAASAAGALPIAALWSREPTDRAAFAAFTAGHGGIAAATPAELLKVLTV